jgi:hypothetical protein
MGLNKFQSVLNQVELFIRKYYTNQIVKGIILFLALLLASFLLVAGLEYLGRFSSGIRLSLLVLFAGLNLFLLVKFLIIPLLKLYKLGRHLTHLDAADMIGSIFPDIGDKLRNTIQLNNDKDRQHLNLELVNASIEQRSENLSIIPFSSGINLVENKKYLKFLLPVILVILLVGFFNPNFFIDGTKRVLNYNQEFIEPAPFQFILESNQNSKEGDDYTLKLRLKGDEIPNEVKVYTNQGAYNLKQSSNVTFEYEFINLKNKLTFYCEANGFTSKEFSVDILKRPVVEDLSLFVIYPKHTGMENKLFANSGDITVPEGSTIQWKIGSSNLTSLKASFNDTTYTINEPANVYNFAKKVFTSQQYSLILSSEDILNSDTLNYRVDVVKDAFPTIGLVEEIDSSNTLRRFISGSIGDDFGFRSLVCKIKVSSNDSIFNKVLPVKIEKNVLKQLFYYELNLKDFDLKPGDKLEYSFTVTDNDALNGFKASSSMRSVFEVPSLVELENQLGEKSDELKADISNASQKAKEIKKDINEVKNELVNKPSLDWKDKQSLENLIQKQAELNKEIQELQDKLEMNNEEKDNFLETSEELKAKQEQLERLMEEMMDEELLDLFKELEELLNEMNKDDLIENLEEMEQSSESMEEELDRTLELFKNMELDMKLENLEEQLKQLGERQEDLLKLTEEGKTSEEELTKRQEDLNSDFEDIKEDIQDVKDKNEELESPRDLEFDKEKEAEIGSEMKEAKEKMEDGKSKKSEPNQSKAAEMLKQMADDVGAMKSVAQEQKAKEDLDALRFLLENLVALSYKQEGLMEQYQLVPSDDPVYLDLNRNQLSIVKSTEIVNDSLVALSKRVMELSSFITKELNDLSYNLDKSMVYSEERKTRSLLQHQQYAMTNYNNLALMLSEVLEQMQNAMKNKMPGNGSCENPGGSGSGGSDKMMTMEEMKKMLSDQIGKMKGGQKPGGEEGKGEDGQGGGEGPGGKQGIPQLGPKGTAKMAAEQGRLRDGLKQLRQELNKDGSGAGNGLDDLIRDLDKLQDDLINGRVGTDYLQRQQEIYTRLLESEKALKERGFSEEREAKEGKNNQDGNLLEFTEYNKKKAAEAEFLRSLPVGLRVYYKGLVNDYFNSVNN